MRVTEVGVRRSKMFVIAFVVTTSALAGVGFAAVYEHGDDVSQCQCGGG